MILDKLTEGLTERKAGRLEGAMLGFFVTVGTFAFFHILVGIA